ncbi:D-malate dehydrogenase (decarboxylating) (plasmid) [Antarctobacter heliothermus]|uniref:D-malate dehydrogenase (Decarboxylating) n=1 Tax=Antarctobacter heliothermus TaxID=74033 RepID=A0A222EC36_9RHOB|nr:D-malate dehydrogenase (decarboxylating) [Antarctobacter heliothermus]
MNLRLVRLSLGVTTAAAGRSAGEIDFFVVRENTEGEYSEVGDRLYAGTEREMAVQETVFTRHGTDRILRYAFDLAQSRGKHLTLATKLNGINYTTPFWDERVAAVAAGYPEVRTDQYHIDILTAHFVQHPDWFVVVASNLFGDILSGLDLACVDAIGQHQPRTRAPLDGRTGPRFCAGYRGQGPRQSYRHLLVGADFA